MVVQNKHIERRSLLNRIMTLGGALMAGGLVSRTASAQTAAPAAAADAPAGPIVGTVGICVTDLEKSLKFYTETFGWTTDANRKLVIDDGIGTLLQLPGGKAQGLIRFVNTGNSMLELMHFDSPAPAGKPSSHRMQNTLGVNNIRVDKVPSISAARDKAKANGGTAPDEAMLVRNGRTVAAVIYDPDGTRIEMTGGA